MSTRKVSRRRTDRRAHHAADLKRSTRLRRLLAVLRISREVSSLELARRANVVALSAAVGELRKLGKRIDCTRRSGVFYYRLAV